MDNLLKKLGIEKAKFFENNFDLLYDKYNKKAKDSGFHGGLKFIKEHNKVIIYVEIIYP
jgi:hypothetical protein